MSAELSIAISLMSLALSVASIVVCLFASHPHWQWNIHCWLYDKKEDVKDWLKRKRGRK